LFVKKKVEKFPKYFIGASEPRRSAFQNTDRINFGSIFRRGKKFGVNRIRCAADDRSIGSPVPKNDRNKILGGFLDSLLIGC